MTAAPVNTHSRSIEECRWEMQNLKEQLDSYASQTEDRLLPVRDTVFRPAEPGSAGLLMEPEWGTSFRMGEQAVHQLSGYLDLQPSFLKRCLDLGMTELAADVLQKFFNRYAATRPDWKLLFRLRHVEGETFVRSLGAERYGIFDNVEALDLLTENLPREWGQPVPLVQYGDADNLRGTLLFPETVVTREEDSDYYMGLFYRNSEIGAGSFGVSSFLFRSYCTNTAIYGSRDAGAPDIKMIHLGEMNLRDIREQLVVGLELARRNGPNLLNLLGYAGDAKVSRPEPVIAHVTESHAWGPLVANRWLNAWHEEPEKSGRGLVNGLTRAAQEFSGERRISMETVATEILSPHILATPIEVQDHWSSQVAGAEAFARNRKKRFEKYFPALGEANRN